MSNAFSSRLEVLESRPDWLTATAKKGHRGDALRAVGIRWVARRSEEGYRLKTFGWQGYEGETTDGISYGSRDDGTLIRLSGEPAAQHFATAHALSDHIARLDLQVTVRDDRPERNWADLAIASAGNDRRIQAGMTKWAMVHSQNAGATAYIGSRISDRFYRVYNKTAESEGAYPKTSWRYEIEYKNARAERVATFMRSSGYGPESVREIVLGAFRDYGINVPAEALDSGWRDAAIVSETTDQRRMMWLERCIKPTLLKLRESFTYSQLLDALGLSLPIIDDETDDVTSNYESHVPHPDVAGTSSAAAG